MSAQQRKAFLRIGKSHFLASKLIPILLYTFWLTGQTVQAQVGDFGGLELIPKVEYVPVSKELRDSLFGSVSAPVSFEPTVSVESVAKNVDEFLGKEIVLNGVLRLKKENSYYLYPSHLEQATDEEKQRLQVVFDKIDTVSIAASKKRDFQAIHKLPNWGFFIGSLLLLKGRLNAQRVFQITDLKQLE